MIGQRAIQPDAAVIKVMSIPDNRCIRVVIPDDHVPNEFHEVLIHDVEVEEPHFVVLSDLGCLRLDWPEALFTFMGRYQMVVPGVQGAVRIHTIRLVYILWPSTFNKIWAGMSPAITWIWHNCGGARRPGVHYGGARPRTVSTI